MRFTKHENQHWTVSPRLSSGTLVNVNSSGARRSDSISSSDTARVSRSSCFSIKATGFCVVPATFRCDILKTNAGSFSFLNKWLPLWNNRYSYVLVVVLVISVVAVVCCRCCCSCSCCLLLLLFLLKLLLLLLLSFCYIVCYIVAVSDLDVVVLSCRNTPEDLRFM